MIESRERSETFSQSNPKTLLIQPIENNDAKQFGILSKKRKNESSNAVESPLYETLEAEFDNIRPLIDFEDSTIHDEKLDLEELKRKYGY